MIYNYDLMGVFLFTEHNLYPSSSPLLASPRIPSHNDPCHASTTNSPPSSPIRQKSKKGNSGDVNEKKQTHGIKFGQNITLQSYVLYIRRGGENGCGSVF